MSVLKGKVGFVIPKNKFSGSLVPIFKKTEPNANANDAAATHETNSHRNTRWAPDLTLDPSLRRAQALAYQTRVDQITHQLNLGLSPTHHSISASAQDAPNNHQKIQSLELERREAIGEILKLNPAYKIPSHYQPLLREATVPIPVKAHPEYNFLALVYGSDGETQKRLEKDTGTTIQVYGTISKTGKKVEITPSDGSEILRVCDEAYVRISADTYEKVDAAADIIDLLLNSVLVKPSDSEAVTSVSEEGQDMTATASTPLQEIMLPVSLPLSFQQYPVSWFPAAQSASLSGVTPIPNSGSLPFGPSFQHPPFGRGPPAPYLMPPRSHSPAPVLQDAQSPYHVVGHPGHPRNFSPAISPSPFGSHQSSIQGSPRLPAPQLYDRPLAPTSDLSISPSQYPSPQGRPTRTFGHSQIRSSSGTPFQSFTPQIQQNSSRPFPFPSPRPSPPPGPSFTPLHSTGPSSRGSNDFTFKSHLPKGPQSQSLPGNNMHFSSQRPSHTPFPPVPQMSPFQPSLQSPRQPIRQSFPRPPAGNQMGPPLVQFGGPNPNPSLHMGLRNQGPIAQFPNTTGSMPHRAGPPSQFQQSQSRPRGIFGGNQHSARPQVYDPFLPSSLPPQGGNPGMARKQESDPEYEDLMASVGVK